MTWYKDRDFPEIKAQGKDGYVDILAVVENPEQLARLIKEYNDLEDKYCDALRAVTRSNENFAKQVDRTARLYHTIQTILDGWDNNGDFYDYLARQALFEDAKHDIG